MSGEPTHDASVTDVEGTGASSADVFNIADNTIAKAIVNYAQKDQDDLLWLATYTRTELGNSRSRVCELLDTTWSTVWKILCGKYEANIESFMELVRDLRRRAEDNADSGFVETPVTRKIFDLFDYAKAGDIDGGKMVMICAPARRSKSAASLEWKRQNNHGSTIYVDCPETGGLRALLLEIAKSTGQHRKRNTFELREAIYASFSRRRMLIVDEVMRLVPPKKSEHRPIQLEFLRRLHDVTKCPIALVVTQSFAEEMNSGALREYLEQFTGRIAEVLYIPEAVRKDECRAICQAFVAKSKGGGDASPALIQLAHKIANEPGKLGVLFELLRQAGTLAKRRGEKLDEKHLGAAYARRKGRYQFGDEK